MTIKIWRMVKLEYKGGHVRVIWNDESEEKYEYSSLKGVLLVFLFGFIITITAGIVITTVIALASLLLPLLLIIFVVVILSILTGSFEIES